MEITTVFPYFLFLKRIVLEFSVRKKVQPRPPNNRCPGLECFIYQDRFFLSQLNRLIVFKVIIQRLKRGYRFMQIIGYRYREYFDVRIFLLAGRHGLYHAIADIEFCGSAGECSIDYYDEAQFQELSEQRHMECFHKRLPGRNDQVER